MRYTGVSIGDVPFFTCLFFENKGLEARVATVLYPSNNGETMVKGIAVKNDTADTKFTLNFADGSSVTLDETDFPASGNADEKFIR